MKNISEKDTIDYLTCVAQMEIGSNDSEFHTTAEKRKILLAKVAILEFLIAYYQTTSIDPDEFRVFNMETVYITKPEELPSVSMAMKTLGVTKEKLEVLKDSIGINVDGKYDKTIYDKINKPLSVYNRVKFQQFLNRGESQGEASAPPSK